MCLFIPCRQEFPTILSNFPIPQPCTKVIQKYCFFLGNSIKNEIYKSRLVSCWLPRSLAELKIYSSYKKRVYRVASSHSPCFAVMLHFHGKRGLWEWLLWDRNVQLSPSFTTQVKVRRRSLLEILWRGTGFRNYSVGLKPCGVSDKIFIDVRACSIYFLFKFSFN